MLGMLEDQVDCAEAREDQHDDGQEVDRERAHHPMEREDRQQEHRRPRDVEHREVLKQRLIEML